MRSIFAALVVSALLLASCGKYNKIMKSPDMQKKYDAAIQYFEKEDYVKALAIFEELVSVYRGTNKAEEVLYYYAYCNYNLEDYILAGFQFKNFVRSFPNSKHAEECAYMIPYCHYLNSPVYSLDQSFTKEAIKEFQAFINQYPESTRLNDANAMVDKLRGKLEKKAFEIAYQYFKISDYKSAIVAFTTMLKDYPDTKYREEVLYTVLKANYLYAMNSVEYKKPERLQNTLDAYFKLIKVYPNGTYHDEVERIYQTVQRELNAKRS